MTDPAISATEGDSTPAVRPPAGSSYLAKLEARLLLIEASLDAHVRARELSWWAKVRAASLHDWLVLLGVIALLAVSWRHGF